jgi:hypothetical protein
LTKDAEKEFLYTQLAKLLSEQSNIRLVFVVREDYFSQLSDLETLMPDLLDSRLRVDPIDPKQAQLIITGIAKHRDINFENQTVIDKIITNLSEADGKINPTFLQLYMEQLCAEAV